MTEINNKSVINEAMVKDNISGAGTTNVHLSQELRESIETVI
ncbi:20167_t:CDS:1, partial [Racocetra persica]